MALCLGLEGRVSLVSPGGCSSGRTARSGRALATGLANALLSTTASTAFSAGLPSLSLDFAYALR
jgi:hypothetical protein